MVISLALSTAPMSTTIISATRRSQVSQPKAKKVKPENKLPTTTSTSGFSGRTKELTWQCVEDCGACCKIAKDFSFATPDEIFDNPDDVEVGLFFHPLLVRRNSSVGVKNLMLNPAVSKHDWR